MHIVTHTHTHTRELSFIIGEESFLELVPRHFNTIGEIAVPEGVDVRFFTTEISDSALCSELGVETPLEDHGGVGDRSILE